jgi:hypothetical protein
MTGLQKAVEHEQASTSEDQKHSQTGFPFKKIVYVGDLSGDPSYGLRYTQKLVHERHAELVLVHSLDPIVYALPGAELRDGAAKAELTAMEHDPERHGANHAVDEGKDIGKGSEKSAHVTVYYTEKAGKKIAHFFEASS